MACTWRSTKPTDGQHDDGQHRRPPIAVRSRAVEFEPGSPIVLDENPQDFSTPAGSACCDVVGAAAGNRAGQATNASSGGRPPDRQSATSASRACAFATACAGRRHLLPGTPECRYARRGCWADEPNMPNEHPVDDHGQPERPDGQTAESGRTTRFRSRGRRRSRRGGRRRSVARAAREPSAGYHEASSRSRRRSDEVQAPPSDAELHHAA